jgi:hypothetical protein
VTVGVSVTVRVGVIDGVGGGVCVCVRVGVAVTVAVAVGVRVGVKVLVGVVVGVGVAVLVAVGVAVLVLVGVAVRVLVGVAVGVRVFVGVLVGVRVTVAVGIGGRGQFTTRASATLTPPFRSLLRKTMVPWMLGEVYALTPVPAPPTRTTCIVPPASGQVNWTLTMPRL